MLHKKLSTFATWNKFYNKAKDLLCVSTFRLRSSYALLFCNIKFFCISVQNFIFYGKINYFISNFMFASSAFILFFRDVKNKNNFFTSAYFSFLIWIFVFLFYFIGDFFNSIWAVFQILWFIFFAFALTINNDKKQYFFSLVGLFLQVLWGFGLIYIGFLMKQVSGADISFTLLPLTVFVYFLKNLKKYL